MKVKVKLNLADNKIIIYKKMKLIQSIKPKLPKRYLLFLAAIAWTFAGCMLLYKGILLLCNAEDYQWLIILTSLICGLLFYFIIFSKVSLKNSNRILNLKIEKPCLFSFFNIKSYIIMTIMITSGILIKKSGLIAPNYLSIIDITMGIPLFISAITFYYYGIYYKKYSI